MLGPCHARAVPPGDATPSDRAPEVLAVGGGRVGCAVLSLSARHPDGDDARYLEWHVLDHLPEQHRLAAIRHGQRWVSTPACRAARAASQAPFDAVDHVVAYLFAPGGDPSLDDFFQLGARLGAIGRMGHALPRVHVGIWDLEAMRADPRVLVGADVVPWRPNRGIHLSIDRPAARPDGWVDPAPGLVDLDGVAGLWRFRGTSGRHSRVQEADGLEATVCYLDGDPAEVADAVHDEMAAAGGGQVPDSVLLAAPFETVTPFAWHRALPG
jgi:hypothetical protein